MEKKYVRSFGKILWLTFITAGIYWWVYLIKTLTHLEKKFSYEIDEPSPRKFKPIFRTIAVFYYIVLIGGLLMLSPQLMKELEYAATVSENPFWGHIASVPNPPASVHMLSNIMIFAMIAMDIIICVLSLNLISLSQKKAGMIPFEKAPLWALLAVHVVLGVIKDASGAVLMASWAASFIFWYIMIRQINRIWLYNPAKANR